MSTKKKPSRRPGQPKRQSSPPAKRDMHAFCKKLWEDMRKLEPLDAAQLRNEKLAELTREEIREYGLLSSSGSNLNFYIGMSS